MPQIDIDATIDFKDITPFFLKTLKQFNPFGPETPNLFFAPNGFWTTEQVD